MAHPPQFDDADPVLAKVRELCLAFPSAAEKVSHGRPCFFTRKIFVIYGAVLKGDHANRFDQSVLFLANSDDAAAFEEDSRFFVPAYWGPSGWWGLDLSPDGGDGGGGGNVDWEEVRELAEDSYRNTATKTLIRQLDE